MELQEFDLGRVVGPVGPIGPEGPPGASPLTQHLVQRFQNTVGVGLHLKTDIPATAAGNVFCRIGGDSERQVRAIDTKISFYHNASGLSTSTQMIMLNNGMDMAPFATFVDTDNTISIYIPYGYQRSLTYAEIYWGTTATTFSGGLRTNRCTDIIRITGEHITSGTNYVRCPIATVFNYGVTRARTHTAWVATQDGNNNNRGNTRTSSKLTLEEAIKATGDLTSSIALYINRFTTQAPLPYDSARPYAVGEKCSSGGFVWTRRIAGTGVSPALTSATWGIDLETQEGMHDFCIFSGEFDPEESYGRGEIVTFPTGQPNNPIMTYICAQTIEASFQGEHTKPTGTLSSNRNWMAIGAYNPVVPVTFSSSGWVQFRMLTGHGTSALEPIDVLFLNSLTLSRNGSVWVESRVRVGSTYNLSYCSSAHQTQTMSALHIDTNHAGTVFFQNVVNTFSRVDHNHCGYVAYRGATTMVTDTPTRQPVSCRGTPLHFVSTTAIIGNNRGNSATVAASPNTAVCFNPNDGGKIFFTGGTSATNITVTISGFRAAVNAGFGGIIEFNNRTLTINKDAPGMLPQPDGHIVFRAETTGEIIRGQNNEIINRNGGSDEFIGNGRFTDKRAA